MNHSILIDYNFKNFKEFKVLLVLQSSPTNPWAQLQEKELTPSTQTPSFLQGLDRQSFISENVYLIKWSLLELYHQYAIKRVWYFFIESKHYLPISHSSPVYPWEHTQVYEPIPSTHDPLFLHGEDSHSLTSKGIEISYMRLDFSKSYYSQIMIRV